MNDTWSITLRRHFALLKRVKTEALDPCKALQMYHSLKLSAREFEQNEQGFWYKNRLLAMFTACV